MRVLSYDGQFRYKLLYQYYLILILRQIQILIGGNLNEYWSTFRRFPRLQGGFIWDWVDQGITVLDSQGQARWAYGGDFGEISHDANFCLNGLNW